MSVNSCARYAGTATRFSDTDVVGKCESLLDFLTRTTCAFRYRHEVAAEFADSFFGEFH